MRNCTRTGIAMVVCLGFLWVVLLLAGQAGAQTWKIEVMDYGTEYNAIAANPAGETHLAYGGNRYGYRDETGWHFDRPYPPLSPYLLRSPVLGTSLTTDAQGLPHLVYKVENQDYVTYAHYTGSEWVFQQNWNHINVVAPYRSSIAIDRQGHPHYFHTDANNGAKYRYYDGAAWQVQSVPYGAVKEMKLDRENLPHLVSNAGAFVWYIRFDGQTWSREELTFPFWPSFSSLALDDADNPHIIACWDGVRYSHRSGGGWAQEAIETGVQVPEARIVADSTGRLHVAYCDQSNNRLKYAYFDDGWHIQVVDQVENIGSYVSLAVDSQGCVHIAYFAQEGLNPYLKYARTISDYYPASQFTFSSQDGKVPFPVQFTDQSTGAITSWFWQFGDGQTSTAKDPLHYYASSGNFDVSLKVSGPAGSSTRIIKNCVYTYTLPPSRPFLAYVGEQLNTFGRLLTIDCRAHAIRERLWLPNEPYGLAASRKGDQVWLSFAGTRSDIWKLDRTTGAITILPTKLGTWALGFSPDDRYLYAATYHGVNYFSRVNLADNAVTAMPLSFGGSRTLAVTPDGRSVFLATESYFDGIEYLAGYFAQISDPNAASPGIEPISVGDMVNWGIAVHPNNRYLYVGAIAPNLVNGYLDVCPLDDFRRFRKRTVILSGWPFGIAVSPDGNWVYVTLDNGAVAIIDTAALTVVKEVVVGGGPRGLAFTPDGKFAYVCSWKKITAIDTANHEIAAIMDTEGWAFDIAIVPAVVGQPGLPSWLPLLLDD